MAQNELSLTKNAKVVRFFIEKGIDHINTIYEFSRNHKSKRPDNDNRIKEIRVQMDINHYRKFKSFHSRKNLFSIAIIVRAFIFFFSQGIKEYGSIEKFLKILKRTEVYFRNKATSYKLIKIFLKKVHKDKNYEVTEQLLLYLIKFLSECLKL